jgi:hypothetical protein
MTTTAEDPITQDASSDAPAIDLPVDPQVRPNRAPRQPRGRAPRRTKVTIRRFGIWSVLRFSLIFSLCLMLVVWLAFLLIFLVLQAGGVIETVTTGDLACLFNETEGTRTCVPIDLNEPAIFTGLLFAGIAMSVAWAFVMTFAAVIYNLIGDMVGGVEVTLSEKVPGAPLDV